MSEFPRQAGAKATLMVIEEIEFEINQWFAGEGNLRDCATRILSLCQDGHEEAGQAPAHF